VAGESFLGGLLGGGAGSVIGGSVVRLFLDDSQFNRALAQSQARNKTAAGTMSAGWAKFGMIASAAAVTAGIALVKFGIDAVGAALEADKMQRRLANSIENSSKVTADSIPVFQAQAQAIRDLTGVDDDAINSMQGFLVQMKLSADQVTELTPLVVDLSAKMGIGLEAAAKAVGKAVNGTVVGLSRMGVVVDKTQAKTDAYGATLKALGVVQGFAAEQAKAEPWRILSMQWGELKEQVGRELLPALKDLVTSGIEVTETFGPALVHLFSGIAVALENFAAAARIATGELSALTDVNWGWLGSILKVVPQFREFGAAIETVNHGLTAGTEAENKRREAAEASIPAMAALHAEDEAYGQSVVKTEAAVRHFANMTVKEIHEWNSSLRDDFQVAEGVFESLSEKANVTATQIINAFMRQINAQNEYGVNWQTLNRRKLPDELRRQLADLGLEGANIIAALANANDRQFNRIIAKWQTSENRANQLANSITGVGTAIDRLPAVKRIQLILDVTENLHGTKLSGAMIGQIRNELMRTQST
jgi:hypothetical protein